VYGPISAPIVSFFAALIEMVTISDTYWYGFLMNFVSSATYSLTASLIYSKFRSLNGALIGIYSAVFVTTATMLGLNILITPLYMQQFLGVPMTASGIVEMIPEILLPFNFAKTLLNSAVVMLIYKPLAVSLSRLGISKKTQGSLKWTKGSLVIVIAGLLSLIVAVVIFLILSSKA
jgi:riboflavin transporter FmnP